MPVSTASPFLAVGAQIVVLALMMLGTGAFTMFFLYALWNFREPME